MLTKRIDLNDSVLTLEELLGQLDQDTEIIITRGDTPIARIESTAIPTVPARQLGLHKGQAWMSDDFTDELPTSF